MLPVKKTSETFVGKTIACHPRNLWNCPMFVWCVIAHIYCYFFFPSNHLHFAPPVWLACRTAKVVTPAVVTAARTPSTKQPRRRVSSLPLDASLERRRRVDPAFLARTPPAKVSYTVGFLFPYSLYLCIVIPCYLYCCVSGLV